MKGSFGGAPTLGDKLFDLLDVAFPGIRSGARNAARLGASWESVSTPYVLFEGDRVVAHVGVIGLPLVVLGRRTTVGSVHAVATHPEYRRRGLCRQIMGEVFEDCAGCYETLILTTEHPEYYTPFGFRTLQEHVFVARPTHRAGIEGMRRLDVSDARDVATLNRLLESRAPVSEVVGVSADKAVFFVNEGRRPLLYAEDLDALFCLEFEGTTLKLFDVVAREIPALGEIIARMPGVVEEVRIHFSPDRLAVEAVAEPYLMDHDGPSHLMARGPFAAEGRAFTLPRPART